VCARPSASLLLTAIAAAVWGAADAMMVEEEEGTKGWGAAGMAAGDLERRLLLESYV